MPRRNVVLGEIPKLSLFSGGSLFATSPSLHLESRLCTKHQISPIQRASRPLLSGHLWPERRQRCLQLVNHNSSREASHKVQLLLKCMPASGCSLARRSSSTHVFLLRKSDSEPSRFILSCEKRRKYLSHSAAAVPGLETLHRVKKAMTIDHTAQAREHSTTDGRKFAPAQGDAYSIS